MKGLIAPTKAKRAHPEDDLHMAVAKLFNHILPPSVIWFHVPNGSSRNFIEAAKLKAMGVKRGVPDLCLMWAARPGVLAVAWIELKAEKGRSSDEQKAFIATAQAMGQAAGVARSLDEVIAFLIEWEVPHNLANRGALIKKWG